jgi:hypothetical protein
VTANTDCRNINFVNSANDLCQKHHTSISVFFFTKIVESTDVFVGFCIIYNVKTAGVSQEVQITVRDSALFPHNQTGCGGSLARIPQRVKMLGPELYTTIFVVGCLLVKERPLWCPYCTLLSHGHISHLLTGCLEADEAGHTTSEFP